MPIRKFINDPIENRDTNYKVRLLGSYRRIEHDSEYKDIFSDQDILDVVLRDCSGAKEILDILDANDIEYDIVVYRKKARIQHMSYDVITESAHVCVNPYAEVLLKISL